MTDLSDAVKGVLAQVDPADSDAALVLYDWLLDTGRLRSFATTTNGMGYLYVYKEPKGATRENYSPGGTEGDRLVTDMLNRAKETGTAKRQGICKFCATVIEHLPGEALPRRSTETGSNRYICSGKDSNGEHAFAG